MSTVTFEDVHDTPTFLDLMVESGITPTKLITELKRELKAKVTKTIKIKGAISSANLSKGCRIIATSGVIYHDKEGDSYGDGDTVIAWDETAWDVRQRARMDAHKLRGDYPATKNEHEFTGKDGGPIECVNYTDLERANRLNYLIQKAITEREKQGG